MKIPHTVLCTLAVCIAATVAADTHTWKQGVSGLWSDATKWDIGEVPANDDTVAFGGSSAIDTVVEIGNAPTVSFPITTSISGGGALVLKGVGGNGKLPVVNNGVEIQFTGGPLVVRDLAVSAKVNNNGANNRLFLTGASSSTTNTILALEGNSSLSVIDTMMFLSGNDSTKGSRLTINDSASLNMSGASSWLHLGRGKNTWGGMEQRGGSVTCEGEVVLGNNENSFGSWEMFAGTTVVSTNIRLSAGAGSNAGLYIHGGKLTLGRYSYFGYTGRSEVFIDGGEMSFPNKEMSLVNRGIDNKDCPSVFTIAGNANVYGFRLYPYGDRDEYKGVSRVMVNLNGNSLLSLTDGFNVKASTSSPRATLSFNGGTFERVTGSPASDQNKNLLKGIDTVVYPGGGRLRARKKDGSASGMNLNNFRLRKAGGYGVASIAVTSGGCGYLLPPLVDIIGGKGSNATAVAQIDYDKQTVTNVIVTCPGEGYAPDDTLSVSFVVPSKPVVTHATATVMLSENVPGTFKIAAGTTVDFGAADFRYDGNFATEEGAYVRISGDVSFGGESAFNSLEIADNGKFTLAGPAQAADIEVKNSGTIAIAGKGSLRVNNNATLKGIIEVARASLEPLVVVAGSCTFGADARIVPDADLPSKAQIPVIKVAGTVTGSAYLDGDELRRWRLISKTQDGSTTYILDPRRRFVMILK